MISFSFLFLCLLLVVVDCFVVSLLTMTKRAKDSTPTLSLQIIELLLRLWDLSLRGFEKAVAISVWQPPHPTHTVITRLCRRSANLVIVSLSLRELLATRGNTYTLSLREPKVCGNLIILGRHCKNKSLL